VEGTESMTAPSGIASGFKPPYYVVVFTSVLREPADGYADMAERMVRLASEQPGFLGMESLREGGLGITVSYWTSEEALVAWKRQAEHRAAQELGRSSWYRQYRVRIARVEREYGFRSDR